MSKENLKTAIELGLIEEEYHKIKDILKREPNFTELSIFAVMWSEHCSYKNSIVWLKTLPKTSEKMLAEAGEENAGLIDLGDNLACCFKIESHNHPSAIEPYQGAATGVGGINRDIFSMGARPIAQLNSLRFGNIETDRTKWLVKGVVKGIGDYGNSFGIPTVGGEVYFDDCYETNILVNAMSAGIVEHNKVVSACADGPGNPVYIFGAATGRDGIHGAAFASKDIGEDAMDDLPSVQVGDPFWEKLILEASLELIDTDAIVGMQDMGAAGITCSTAEMSAKSGTGMEIDLDKVPLRQPMKDWEILLSESQERMLIIIEKGKESKVEKILEKWDLAYAQIGNVTDTGRVRFYQNGKLCSDLPADDLVLGGGAPVYHREWETPQYFKEIEKYDASKIEMPNNLIDVAQFITQLPNIASKRWIYRQYDSMVGTINQSTNAPSDASVVKIAGTDKSLVLTVDCNSRYVHADPCIGTQIAVSEAARNVVCSGGEPQAITNCLNFGNPYNKEVYYQFKHAIDGMRIACEKFKTPVTGGNVSFYNQNSDGTSVYPTPTIGMMGVIENQDWKTTLDFKEEGHILLLLGTVTEDIACSQYLSKYHKVEYSPAPYFNLDEEAELHKNLTALIRKGIVKSCHDISEGGLFVSLLESAMYNGLGFEIIAPSDIRPDAFLFGEGQGRAVISIDKDDLKYVHEIAPDTTILGLVKGNEAKVNSVSFGSIEDFKVSYDNAIEDKLMN